MKNSLIHSRFSAWVIWGVASLFYAYQYLLRVMPSVFLGDIMEQFHIQAATFGQFSGVYYIGYSLLHLPVGYALDRYGPKKVVSMCLLLMVAGLLPLLFASHWAYPIAGRFLIGLGSSAAILGLFKIIRMVFSARHFPRMLSFSVTIGLLGAIYGGGPMNYLRTSCGYAHALEIVALLGLLLAGITYWLFPGADRVASSSNLLADVKEVLGNRKVLWLCLAAGCMVGPLEGFADVWATLFLQRVYGYESGIAASLPSLIFLGMCVGSPLLSMLAERIGSYIVTVIGAGALMTLLFTSFLFIQWPPALLSLLFVLLGVCCAYQILAIYQASTYVREGVAGLTTAIANMTIMIFGYLFHSIMGWVINYRGGPTLSPALLSGVVILPIALCIGTLGFIGVFTREKRSQKEPLSSLEKSP